MTAKGVWPFIALFSVAVAIIVGSAYYFVTGRGLGMTLFVMTFTAVLTGLIVKRNIELQQERSATPEQSDVSVNQTYNYLGSRLDRYRHLMVVEGSDENARDTIIDFADRPALVQGAIDTGLPLLITALALWGTHQFSGLGTVARAVLNGNWPIIGLVVAVTASLVAWGMVSAWENSITRRTLIIRLILAVAIIGVWTAIGYPFGPLLMQAITHNPSTIWALVAWVTLIWTISRAMRYHGSYHILTNTSLKVGNVGWLLEEDRNYVMPRTKAATLTFKRGWWRTLLGYTLVIAEGAGDEDDQFHALRVRNGRKLQGVLSLK